MVTLSASEASRNLDGLLSRVLKGEEIGIECQGRIVALRPVGGEFEDAMAGYGLGKEETERAYDKVSAEIEEERRSGKLKKL